MAPVVASSAGVARQTIDDPRLIALLDRLSQFEVASPADVDVDVDVADVADAVADGGVTSDVAAPRDDDDDVAMADAAEDDDRGAMGDEHEDAPRSSNRETKLSSPPPFDIDALAAELDRVPGWRFQEQVSLCSTRGGMGVGRRDGNRDSYRSI